MQNRSKSRRHTPWDGEKDVTATQEFLRTHYHARYEERHPALQDAGEAAHPGGGQLRPGGLPGGGMEQVPE